MNHIRVITFFLAIYCIVISCFTCYKSLAFKRRERSEKYTGDKHVAFVHDVPKREASMVIVSRAFFDDPFDVRFDSIWNRTGGPTTPIFSIKDMSLDAQTPMFRTIVPTDLVGWKLATVVDVNLLHAEKGLTTSFPARFISRLSFNFSQPFL